MTPLCMADFALILASMTRNRNAFMNLKLKRGPQWPCDKGLRLQCERFGVQICVASSQWSGSIGILGAILQDVCWLVACLTSQQHASVSQGRICTDNFTCCHTETEVADQTVYLTQSQYTDTVPTSPSADLIMPGAWQGSHWSANL